MYAAFTSSSGNRESLYNIFNSVCIFVCKRALMKLGIFWSEFGMTFVYLSMAFILLNNSRKNEKTTEFLRYISS